MTLMEKSFKSSVLRIETEIFFENPKDKIAKKARVNAICFLSSVITISTLNRL
jgi:hypothetical protein